MTRVLLTFLVGLVVSLGALVSGGSGVAWAGNWNQSKSQKAIQNIQRNIHTWSNQSVCDDVDFYVAGGQGLPQNHYSWVSHDHLPSDYKAVLFKEAKRRGLRCGVDNTGTVLQAVSSSVAPLNAFDDFTDVTLCRMATTQVKGSQVWKKRNGQFFYAQPYVKEAKRRGLSCGVGEATQTASALKIKPKADPTPANTATTTQSNSLTSIAMTTGSIEPWMSSTSERFEDRIIRNWCAPPNETTLGGEPFLDPNSSTWNRCAVNKGPKPSPISYETVKRFYTKSENRKLLCRRVKKYKSYEETLSLLKSGTSKSALTYFILARDVELDCSKKEAVNSDVLSANAIEQLDSERQKRIKLEQQLAALKAQQEQQKQTFSSDARLPKITIASVNTKGKQGIVRGRVDDNTGIAEVTVDGTVIPITGNGNFEYSTFVPSGGLSLKVQATDLAGLTSMMSVTLKRNAGTAAAAINFDRLNPIGKRAKTNKDALALIVGVADYENTPAKAIFADSDARMFQDYASEKLGIPESRIKTLVNDGADERELLLAVKSWLARASKQGKSDVYVFFAGHGLASDNGEKMYLLPYDGSPELLDDTAILRDRLFSDIASANPRSVTVFLDTCYSGTTRGTDMLIASRPIAIKALEQSIPDNFTVMTAAAGDQTAKPLEEAKHGMFSYFLMKGMEGEADENQDNKITAGELHQYVQSNVVQQSSGSQTPELQGDAERVLVRFQ